MPRLALACALLAISCRSCSAPAPEPEPSAAEPLPPAQEAGEDPPGGGRGDAVDPVVATDLLARPERLEAGAHGLRYADLARPSGLWILRDREVVRGWSRSSAGGLGGIALGDEPLVIRLAAGEADGRCASLLVGSDDQAEVRIGRAGGRAQRIAIEPGATLLPGQCPVPGDAITDLVVSVKAGEAVIAGVWLAAGGAAIPAAPPAVEACEDGTGVLVPPGGSVSAAALASPGSTISALALGKGAASLRIEILADGAGEPARLEPGADGASVAAPIRDGRPTAVEVTASLPPGTEAPACLARLAVEAPAGPAPPGHRTADAVVLVMSDTMRGDLYPHDGSSFGVPMPNMERLASRSTNFTRATAHASYTKPSVGTILTGLYPEDHGGLPRKAPIRAGATLVTEILEEAGVRTVAFLSNFFFNPAFGLRRGWTEEHFIDPWGAALDDAIVLEEFEKWCDAGVPGGPLFVYVHLMAAHAPYTPPERLMREFLDGAAPSSRLSPRHTAQLIKDLTSGKEPRLKPRERAQLRALYRADAAYHDEVMGRLLGAMERAGLLDRALLIYTSDHGEEFYEHGRVGHGTGLWREQVHVPLIVHAPGQVEGREVTGLAGHVDIVPTVLAALGAKAPPLPHGKDLLQIDEETGAGYRPLLLQHWTGRWGVQLGPWKLQRRIADERLSWSLDEVEGEVRLADAPILHALMRRHLAWAYLELGAGQGAGDEEGFALPDELQEQLEKLGYIVK